MCNLSDALIEDALVRGEERGREIGEKNGEERGEKQGILRSIKNLMVNASVDAKKAMDMLGLSKEEQEFYLPLI